MVPVVAKHRGRAHRNEKSFAWLDAQTNGVAIWKREADQAWTHQARDLLRRTRWCIQNMPMPEMSVLRVDRKRPASNPGAEARSRILIGEP
jgi:hypothetical protein